MLSTKFGLRREAVAQFAGETGGGAAVIFGLAVIPVIFMMGGAVDFTKVTTARSGLVQAADNGALAAARTAAHRLVAGDSNWNAAGVVAGQNTFLANAANVRSASAGAPNVVVAQAGASITAQVTYFAQVGTSFLKLAKLPVVNLSNTVSATTPLNLYANVSLVLDVSPSMALAATAADMATLKSVTLAQAGRACAFACHDADSGQPLSYYELARNNGVPLRIDIVKNATQALTNHISGVSSVPGQYTVGLYSMASSLKTLVAPTSTISNVTTAIGAVDFDRMSSVAPTLPAPAAANIASGASLEHYADTDFSASLAALNSTVPTAGDGVGSASRQQIVFLVTDGLSDTGVASNASISATYYYPPVATFPGGNNMAKLTAPLNPSHCAALKARGVKVAVLYVTYLADPTDPNGFYQAMVEHNAPPAALVSNLASCASSANLFYEASDLAGIQDGLITLFRNATTAPLRLTQ